MSYIVPSAKGRLITRESANLVELPVGSDGQVLTADSAQAAGIKWASGGGVSTAKITSSLSSTNSTSLTNTTGLSFGVGNGIFYAFRFLVVFRMSDVTDGLKIGLTCPTVDVFSASVDIPQTADGLGADYEGCINSSGDSVAAAATPVANSDFTAVIDGVIKPSANGTLQVQHAVTAGAASVTIRLGSCGFLWELGT